jgi:N utilization substance protein A
MELETKQLVMAIKAIAEEKNLPEPMVQEIVEQALAAAYRRDFGDREQNVRVTININTGEVDAYVAKEIVEGEPEDDRFEISLKEAQAMRKEAEVGETVEFHEKVESFGRVAAQTAKQVILQRLREAEREIVMAEYEDKIGQILNGLVARVEGRLVRIDLGKAQAIMPQSEQIQSERYYPGQRLKVYLKDIERGFRGPQLIVSRGSSAFMELLFRAEVPEMESGSVEIKGISREAGVRSKIAVSSTVAGVDPVGTFVGGHGTRVNAVMSEIGEQEKIDIVVFSDNMPEYISNALSPTKVSKVTLDENTKKAIVTVPEDQLSVAIGKNGQNVRLASKLSGYDIDIVADRGEYARPEHRPEPAKTEAPAAETKAAEPAAPAATPATPAAPAAKPKLKRKSELESSLLNAIEEHGE